MDSSRKNFWMISISLCCIKEFRTSCGQNQDVLLSLMSGSRYIGGKMWEIFPGGTDIDTDLVRVNGIFEMQN